jgi:hypothetical protein
MCTLAGGPDLSPVKSSRLASCTSHIIVPPSYTYRPRRRRVAIDVVVVVAPSSSTSRPVEYLLDQLSGRLSLQGAVHHAPACGSA